MLAVCKSYLCLLTWTGRAFYGNWTSGTESKWSIDENWTDYRRKMGVLLKEKYGLLTETGWCVDWNWMVNSRKLVGLLMEAVQQIFFIMGAWKCDFAEFRNTRFRGHLAFFNSFFPFWRLPNMIFTESWYPGFKTTKHRVSKFYAFWHPENAISADSWNQRFEEPRKDWGNFIHFSCLKCAFAQ